MIHTPAHILSHTYAYVNVMLSVLMLWFICVLSFQNSCTINCKIVFLYIFIQFTNKVNFDLKSYSTNV